MKKSLYIRVCQKALVLIVILLPFFNGAALQAHSLSNRIGSTTFSVAESGLNFYMEDAALTIYSNRAFSSLPDNLLQSDFFDFANYAVVNNFSVPAPGNTLPAPPTITCPGNIAAVCDAGICTATVNGLAATINDPDGDITTLTWAMTGATLATSPATGINNLANYIFNVGITTVTYTVTDALGTSVSCSFTVTVADTQFPSLTCPANINATFGEGQCNASVTIVAPVATDNCGSPAVTGTRSDGLSVNAPYPAGITTITWTATDVNGNITTCPQTVTITKGVLLVNYTFVGATGYPISPNQSATGINCQATSTEPFFINNTEGIASGPLSFVNNAIAFPAIYMDPSNFTNTRYFQFHVSGDSLYKYRKFKLYVQAKRGNRAAQTINFAYSTDPFSYTVNGSMSLISAGTWYEKVVDWSGVSLINNRSDLYIRLFASNGTGGVGDGRLFIDNFQVVGYDGPLARPNSASIPENTPVTIPVLGNDYYGCNGPIPGTPVSIASFPSQGNVVLNPDGTITYTPNPNVNGSDSFIYQICDASGSCDTSIVNITITPVSYAPIVSCPGDINSGSDVGVCGAQVNDLAATIYDQDGNITTLKWIMTGANNDASPTTGINYLAPYNFNFGVSTITYIVIDSEGLSDTCSFTVNVYDSENPSIVCPEDTVFTIPDCATLTDTLVLVPPVVSDPCGIQDLTSNAPLQFPVGNTSVIWTVTDINGNTSACEQIVTVTKASPVTLAVSSTPVSCFGGNNGTATASVSGGSPPYQVTWFTVPIQTTPSITNLTTGTYSVKVTDADGCSDSTSVTVTQPTDSLRVAVTSQVNVACFGNSSGSVTVAGNGGTPGYTYSINGVVFQASNTFSGLAAGTYIITIRDSRGCVDTTSVNITQPASALTATATVISNVVCAGQANGSAYVLASGGTAPYSFSWNTVPVQTNDTATNLTGGTYIVTVTDALGCVQTASVTITQPSLPLTATVTTQVNVACFGGSTGSVTITANGGTPAYTYSLNGGTPQASGTFLNLSAGSYTVTVTDASNCTFDLPFTIGQPAAALTVSITSQTNVACFGQATGSATAAAAGGTGPYAYTWLTTPVQTSATAINLPAGTYTVNVVDALGCLGSTSVTITQPANALSGTITSQTNVTCFSALSGSVTVTGSGGTPPYQYSINGGPLQVSGTFNNLAAGSYTVIVMDANNCIFPVLVTITQPASALTAAITSQTNIACSGQSTGSATVTASGGTSPYTYSWNTFPVQTTPTISNLSAGTYIVTVTDALGCTATATATITQPANPLTVSITNQVNVACFGQSTGSATATVSGGTQPYTYSWNTVPVQVTATATNLAAGSYTVTVTDGSGCNVTASVTITAPLSALSASIINQVNVLCTGNPTGSVTVAGNGGTPPYQYSINGSPLQASGTFNSLAAGSYTIIVMDANNCIFAVPVNITQPVSALTASITAQTNIACSGQATGSATVTASGGTSPYTYSWNTVPVQTTPTINNLASGTYIVTVTDAAGCTTTATATITQPANPLSVTITNQVNVACFGQSTGSATATVTGGTQPYTYSWNTVPVQTTATATNLAAGNYIVTVTDGTGCVVTAPVTITAPASALTAAITNQVNVLCAGNPTGSVTVSANGGTAPYQFSINGGPLQAGGTFNNLVAGSYTIIVIDANNCIFPVPVTITQPASALSASITSQTNITCSGQATGSATVTASGGTLPYSYSWNTVPVQTTATAINLPAGTYIVTVTDASGCVATATVDITQPLNPLVVTIGNQVNVACFGQSTGSATALVSGGTGPFAFSWNTVPVQTTATATPLAAGTYIVTVTDGNGCTDTASVIITQPATALALTVTNQVNVSCNGANTGSITVSGSGGTPPYQYSINGGTLQSSGTFNNLFAGVYTIVVTDANNCSESIPVNLTQPATALTATITAQTNVSCAGQSNGSATVTANGGILPYSYSWNTIPAQTTATATNLSAGTYIVTVTDGSGCVATTSVDITQPAPLTVSIVNQVNVACFGQSTGSATALVSGGTPPYTYAWLTTPVQSGATASNLPAGTFTVAIFDSKGCFTSTTATILQPASTLTGAITNQVNVACLGNATGSVTVTGSGGTPIYQYSLNGGLYQASGTFTNLIAGVYTVTVKDANNCTFVVPVIITEPATGITASISNQVNVLCFGQATGSVTITVNTGTPPYQFSLNGGTPQGSGTFNNLVAGNYTITVSDASACTRDIPVTIIQPSAILAATISAQVNIACFGEATGSATATASGGTAPYLYSWNTVPVQTTPEASGLVAGTYIVTVTDSNACTDSDTVVIISPASPLTATVTNVIQVNCFGSATGSISVSGSGGTMPYQYSLNGGTYQSGGTFSNLVAGNYNITVRDTNNCTVIVPVTITEPLSGISLTTSTVDIICKGTASGSATVTASGGTPPYSYVWNTVPAQTTPTATNLSAGTYAVIVTDAAGCTANANVTISEPALGLSVSISNVVPVLCFGDNTGSATAVVSNGTPPITYLWNSVPPQSTVVATNLPVGSYFVTVTDTNGCLDTANVSISGPATALSGSIISQVNADCAGNATGSVTVAGAGGTPGYMYNIDGGAYQSSGTFTNLAAGSYLVKVQDANNCTVPVSVDITVIDLLQALNDTTTTPEDIPVSGNVMTNDMGFCHPPVIVTANTLPVNGSVIVNSDGSFTYTPSPGYNGNDSFTYTITDINGNISTATVFITIDPINDPPVTFNEYLTVPFNQTVSGNVLLNGDYDPDGTALTVSTSPVVSPANGTFTIAPDGSFTYTPNLNYTGNDLVIVSVCDAGIPLPPACTNDTIFIVVLPLNLPPVTINETIGICQGASFVGTVSNGGTVFNGDTDPENNIPLTVSNTLVVAPLHGVFSFTDTITGTFNYTPNSGYNGNDMVVVQICDSGTPVACNNDTIFIQILNAVVANAGFSQMLCNADVTFLVGNSPAPGTGSWAYVSGPNIPNLFPPVGSVAVATGLIPSAVPYVFSYTISNGGCNSVDTMSVINYIPPTPSYAGIDQKFCSASGNVSTNLAGNTPVFGTGTWIQLNGPNTATIADPADPNTAVTNLTYGTYAFMWIISNGVCQVDADVVNIIVSQPVMVDAGADAIICEGSSHSLVSASASNFSSLFWTSSGTGIFDDPTILNPVYTPSPTDITNGTVALTLTATGNEPCPEVSDQMILTINHSPLVYAGSDASVCANSPYTVTDATVQYSSNYFWTTSGAGLLTANTTLSPTYTPAPGETGNITLILFGIVNAPCSNTSDTMVLTIQPEVKAYAGPDTAICENGFYLVSGSSANNSLSLLWTTSGTGSFNDPAILNPVYIPSPNDINDGFVYLTLTATGGVSCPVASDVMKLSIAHKPLADAGPDAQVCESSVFTVSQATAQNYNALLWTTTGLGTLTGENTLTPVYTPATGESGVIILTMIVTGNTACAPATDQMQLFIQPATLVDAGPDLSSCEMSPVPITGAIASNYSSVLWTTSGNGTFSDPASENPIYQPGSLDAALGIVMLTLNAYGAGPCSDASDQLTLTLNKAPLANAGPDAVTCVGVGFTITLATASNYSSVQWSVTPASAGTLTNYGTLSPTFMPASGFSGTATLTLRAQGIGACGNVIISSAMDVFVNTSLVADAGPDQNVHSGTATALTGSASGGSGFYAWSWQPADLLVNPSVENPVTLPLAEPVTFTLTVMDISTGCTDNDTMDVFIGSGGNSIIAVADYDTTLVNVPVTVNVLGNDINPEGDPLTVSLCGFPSNGIVVLNSDKTITYTPYADFEGDDFLCYRICSVLQPSLCSDTMVYIHVKQPSLDDLFVYSGVSPNGDGNNDTWKIRGIEKYPDNTILIFNRWGDKIREFANYNNTTRSWNGKNENGDPLPDGTYFYILDVKNVGTLKGWISLRGGRK